MENKKKTTKKVQTASADKKKVEAAESTKAPVQKRSWNIGAVFFGLLLIAFGALLLLANFGLVEVSWNELWRLWPMLIVATGFSVLATTHWLWKLLSLVFVFVAFFAVIWIGTGQYKASVGDLSGCSVSVDAERGVAQSNVTIQAGASALTIGSDDMANVAKATLQSDSLRIKEESKRDGTTQIVTLSGKTHRNAWFGGPHQNIWDIVLTERLPIKLTINAGASSTKADLSGLQLNDLQVKAGASSTVIILGNKVAKLNVDVDSGASSTTLRVPKDSGVAVSFEGGLSSRELEGLKEVSSGDYQSSNYETAENIILINVKAGLASFKVETY